MYINVVTAKEIRNLKSKYIARTKENRTQIKETSI